MKKLVLTMVALVAMSTASFAQYSDLDRAISRYLNSSRLSSISYNVPSRVNINTTSVSGYYRSSGSYVNSHVRSMPNATNWDNFSTRGNTNPITGSTGYRALDYSKDALNYGSGHKIYTGPRGGQYYYNGSGNKVYVPKRSW